jgi:hypothetical protein
VDFEQPLDFVNLLGKLLDQLGGGSHACVVSLSAKNLSLKVR